MQLSVAAARTVLVALFLGALWLPAQRPPIVWSDQEKPLVARMKLRSVPDDQRAAATKSLALDIRVLPPSLNKLTLAANLTGLSTEGDFGRDTLIEVANTMAAALAEQKPAGVEQYSSLAQLARYEHIPVSLDLPQYAAALKALEQDDAARANADFTLTDQDGKTWHLRDLHGKVVLVNFWATWCPPCRKEFPDLDALYRKFHKSGLIILAISDEEAAKVQRFVADRQPSFPVLLDPGRQVNNTFRVQGIPKSFVFDRDGRLVAQAIDMRTQGQFLEMLAKAGLQ